MWDSVLMVKMHNKDLFWYECSSYKQDTYILKKSTEGWTFICIETLRIYTSERHTEYPLVNIPPAE